jgi:hypothetical protein
LGVALTSGRTPPRRECGFHWENGFADKNTANSESRLSKAFGSTIAVATFEQTSMD